MEGKFDAPKGIPTRKRREVMDTASPETLRVEAFPKEKHEVKHELYALASFLIERYHRKTLEVLYRCPDQSLRDLQDMFIENRTFAEALVLDRGRIRLSSEALSEVSDDVVAQAFQSEMVFPRIYMRAFDRSFVAARDEFDDRSKAVYGRLSDLLYKSQARMVLGFGANGPRRRVQSIEGFIRSGVVTATTESWNIILAIIKKYNREFHEPLTEEVFDTLTPDVKKILNQVASLNLADLAYLRDLALEPGGVDLKQVGWDKILVFTGESDTLHLAIKEEYRHLDKQSRERKECTVGCPGRDAIIENEAGKKVNVVGDVYDFHQVLAKDILLPHQRVLIDAEKQI